MDEYTSKFTGEEIDERLELAETALQGDDVVDSLTSGDKKKPLSAAQGKALKAFIDAMGWEGGGGGDMLAAIYDPGNILKDVFDSANTTYDNEESELDAETVKEAIDVLASLIGGAGAGDMDKATYDPNEVEADAFDGSNHSYDNAVSGLMSTDVQGAIDEVASVADSNTLALANKAPIASPAFAGSTPTTEGNLMYHVGNITISTSAPVSALTEGHQHQVYEVGD